MKKLLKLLIFILLICPFSVMAGTLDTKDYNLDFNRTTYGTYADAQKIIKEVMRSYYIRGRNIQYNNSKTEYPIGAPEEATGQDNNYSVCAAFTYSVHNQTFGMKYQSSATAPEFPEYNYDITDKAYAYYKTNIETDAGMKKGDGTFLIYYQHSLNEHSNSCEIENVNNSDNKVKYVYGDTNTSSPDGDLETLTNNVRSGDLVAYSGHALIVYDVAVNPNTGKKDVIILNSTPSEYIGTRIAGTSKISYNLFPSQYGNNGKIYYNEEGTIQYLWLSQMDEFVKTKEDGTKILSCQKHECAVIRTFYEDEEGNAVFNYPITENQYKKAELRTQYPGLKIEKTVNKGDNNEINLGDELIYNIKIENLSATTGNDKGEFIGFTYDNFTVKETLKGIVGKQEKKLIGDNLEFIEASNGGQNNEGTITWDISALEPGKSITLTFKVKVKKHIDNINVIIHSKGTFRDPENSEVYLSTGTVKNLVKIKQYEPKNSFASCYTFITDYYYKHLEQIKTGLELIDEIYACTNDKNFEHKYVSKVWDSTTNKYVKEYHYADYATGGEFCFDESATCDRVLKEEYSKGLLNLKNFNFDDLFEISLQKSNVYKTRSNQNSNDEKYLLCVDKEGNEVECKCDGEYSDKTDCKLASGYRYLYNASNPKNKLYFKIKNSEKAFSNMILNNYFSGIYYYDGKYYDSEKGKYYEYYNSSNYKKDYYFPRIYNDSADYKRARTVNPRDFKNGDILIYYMEDKSGILKTNEDGLYSYVFVSNDNVNAFIGRNGDENNKNVRTKFDYTYYKSNYAREASSETCNNKYGISAGEECDYKIYLWEAYGKGGINENTAKDLLNFANYQTLFDKDYYVILRPSVEQLENITFTEPTKTSYIQYEDELDLSGGKITLSYLNGDTEDISLNSSNITVSGYDNQTLGKKTVTLTYDEQYEMTYDVDVIPRYTIRYNHDGGSFSDFYLAGEEFYLSSDVEKEGYTLVGWENASTNQCYGLLEKFVMPENDVIMEAVWEANTYEITYEPNGGNVENNIFEVTFDTVYGNLETPTKLGYTFKGWYLENTYETEVTSTTVVTTSSNHILYAKWEANIYELVFVLHGGVLDNNYYEVTYGETYGELPIPTKTGYTFVGWYFDGQYQNLVTSDTIVDVASNHTLYAKWEANIYEVTYDYLNTKFNVTYGSAYGTLEIPEKEGYTFVGWYLEDTYKTKVTNYTNVTTATNHKLYAKWDAGQYKLVIDAQGGEFEGSKEIMLDYNETVEITTPTKIGYTFKGWTVTGEGSSINGTTFKMGTSNATLTANWEANQYEVTYDYTNETFEVTYDKAYGNLETPTKEGYTFKGWYLENTYETEVTSTTVVTTAINHMLYAKWELSTYVLTVNPNGGLYSSDMELELKYGETISLGTPTKEGYTLIGWEMNAACYSLTDVIKMPAKNVEIKAMYQANQYEVTYESLNKKFNVTYGSAYGNLETPTKEGYTFKGWYLEDTYETEVTSTTVVTTAINHMLYAKWDAGQYKLVIDAQGGEFEGSKEIMLDYNETIEITTPIKIGYTFKGWTVTGEGSSINGTTFKMGTSNATLTAKWELIIPDIEKTSDYEINGEMLSKVSLETEVDELDLGLSNIYAIKVINNKNNTEKTSGYVATADKVQIYLRDTLVSEYKVVIKGDVSGDGIADVADFSKAYQYYKKRITMAEHFIEAADVANTEEKIQMADVSKIYQFIKGRIPSVN